LPEIDRRQEGTTGHGERGYGKIHRFSPNKDFYNACRDQIRRAESKTSDRFVKPNLTTRLNNRAIKNLLGIAKRAIVPFLAFENKTKFLISRKTCRVGTRLHPRIMIRTASRDGRQAGAGDRCRDQIGTNPP
jgi:hypothetical protein